MDEGVPPPSLDRLRALPGVREARIDAGRISLNCAQIHSAVPALMDVPRARCRAPAHRSRHTVPRSRTCSCTSRGGTCAMTERPASHPLVELTVSRFREFLREPEALFWTFAFPVLMTCALGLAFRTQAPKPVPIGVGEGAGRASRRRASGRPAPNSTCGRCRANPSSARCAAGECTSWSCPAIPPVLRFDPTRPESRLARLAVLSALGPSPHTASIARDEVVSARGRGTSTGSCRACSASTS